LTQMSYTKIENWDSRRYYPSGQHQHVVHDNLYYLKCMVGGILSCGLTHTAVVPLDIAKCKMQVFPEKYKGLLPSLSLIAKEQGLSGMKLGWLPTLIGYSLQGLFKFGLYEFFKDYYSNLAGQENAGKYKKINLVSRFCFC